eukprot:COSAG01_NODE_3516_length_5981_cov_5.929446_7_plen_66_part_00
MGSTRSFEVYRQTTVLMVDIVGFTRLSSGMRPAEVVLLLHQLVRDEPAPIVLASASLAETGLPAG